MSFPNFQSLSPELQALQSTLQEQGVKYAMASFVDIHGMCKGKVVPMSHFDRMMQGSELFTGAALDGVPQEINDDEVGTMPDPDSVTVLPWNSEIAWFASDLHLVGEPFEACSRTILKRVLKQAADMGYRFNLGIETEFFIFKETESGFSPVSDRDTLPKAAYALPTVLDNYKIIDRIVSAMNDLGWDVYSFDHEDAQGQFETDFTYCDGLKMADRLTFFRFMVKELAREEGYFASFMPKPFANQTGSGAHYNMSLADPETGKNLFEDPLDTCGLSKLGYQFIAGVLKHAKAIVSVTCPTVNSYKRLVRKGSMSGFTWAPVYVCYGNNNRTNMLRIPLGGGRVECRAADISTNLYLGAAMILAAGLEGIREGLDPGAPHTENMYDYSLEELKEMGVETLPKTLGDAIASFAADPLSKEVMGPLMYQTYIDFKTQEWEEYHCHISDWEIQRYLKFF
ncbi:Glutamate--methylamine ligase [Acaryochloris thomasi RCC1774]|uniref:Glutamate--methylamine ligase n=1 Tax=Acaryochloris thomasi RCC1774 TaxID=1764569 RepID=A0A2W1JK79_9CYAN|nr:type III glutamate--ammonia ligase [Acaryochloris thomasi]PZD71885.1 Glutamate--methylamine ligase [Acaryochloris thomasi RCC1774]